MKSALLPQDELILAHRTFVAPLLRLLVAVFLGLGGGLGLAPAAFAQASLAPAASPALESLRILTKAGPQQFAVEVMRSDAEREKGLMFRRFMPADHGMLFDFKAPQPVMMWMKNTYIPLDMLFMARDGRVVGIAQNAEPLSERIIPSGAPTSAVLELNAGTVARLGIAVGDRVEHAMFVR